MNTKNTQDPWLGGQKQIKFPVPGWIVFLVKAPFRLLFGLLGAAAVVSADHVDTSEESSVPKRDQSYNWDGSINTDGDVTSGK